MKTSKELQASLTSVKVRYTQNRRNQKGVKYVEYTQHCKPGNLNVVLFILNFKLLQLQLLRGVSKWCVKCGAKWTKPYACEVLTSTVAAQIVRDSCIAIRQKAVMDASESVPCTSPYMFTDTEKHVRAIIIITIISTRHLFIHLR